MAAHVWIIDDDPDVAVHLELVLSRAGFETTVHVFEDGSSAMAAIAGAEPPALATLRELVVPDPRDS